MIGKRQKTFSALYALLRGVQTDPENLQQVLNLNMQILSAVIRAENGIRRCRAISRQFRVELKTGRKPKERTLFLREKIRKAEAVIEECYQQIYIWKCFGDGLAFCYLDKFSVKHTFFDTDVYEEKAGAGMLSGKDGLSEEIACLHSAIENDVPAVLSDITNVIRYGDVCLLGASDPYLLEVKSSRRLNKRGKRQAELLKKLTDFLEADAAEDFRGVPEVRRAAFDNPERTHIEAINACIEVAEKEGSAVMQPESGLTYIAAYKGDSIGTALSDQKMGQQILFLLNSDKSAAAWGVYYPFTLSINDQKHLYDFIVGNLVIAVAVDVDAYCQLISRPGWKVSYNPGESYLIQLYNPVSETQIGLSGQFFARIGYEFVSPAWMADCQSQQVREIEQTLLSGGGKSLAQDELNEIREKYFGRLRE